jgi:hypothetical protein
MGKAWLPEITLYDGPGGLPGLHGQQGWGDVWPPHPQLLQRAEEAGRSLGVSGADGGTLTRMWATITGDREVVAPRVEP